MRSNVSFRTQKRTLGVRSFSNRAKTPTPERIMSGIYAPVPTIFDKDGHLELHKMLDNLKKLLHENPKMGGLVVLGSNGEYPHLNGEERLKVLESVARGLSHGQEHVLIAGTGANSTVETIDITKRAADMGYNAAMVVTPYYFKPQMNDAALVHHFNAVASASPIPVILYNVPNFTGIDITNYAVEKLARHPNIIGIKESSGNIVKTAQLVSLGKDIAAKNEGFFGVFAGSGSYYLPALTVGAKGGVMALANILCSDLIHLEHLFHSGQLQKATDLQAALVEINQAVTKTYGVPGLKSAMNLLQMNGGTPRSPLLPLKEEDTEKIRDLLLKLHNFRVQHFGIKGHVIL